MRIAVFVLAAGLYAAPAVSADKVQFGAAPSWVTPIALPPSPVVTGDAPVRMILADQQLSFENGEIASYTDVALKVLTAQGLAAGNINFAWSPESDTVTVHKLVIRRGSQVIDVLASGQTFTVVRRESNLESAMLDGVLTASIQPEGLQVGDIIELAVTTVRRDPVMKGHVEAIGAAWNGLQITRGHFRAQWPATMNVQFRAANGLGKTSLVTRGGRKILELTQDNIEPLLPPKGAPARFSVGPSIELTDFASWDQPAKLLGPLYAAASKIPATGPLREEVEKIRTGSASPTVRTEAALKLVQERVRYVALLMGTAGYVPAKAVDTWSRRFGDCKAKTALLLGILHELGIKAEPVAVNAAGDEAISARLPMLGLFNHVLVRTSLEGRDYWLDGTRLGDINLARVQTPSLGWGLPLVDGANLARLQAAPLAHPTMETIIKTDASAGLTVPAPSQYEVVMRGDFATALNTMISSVSGAQRDQMLNAFFKNTFSDLEVKTARMAYDQSSGEMRFFADGALTMDWSSGSYEPEGTAVGFKPEFDRPAGPMQQVPFAIEYPTYTRVSQSIILPAGFGGGRTQPIPELKETLAGVEYHRKASFEKDLFKVTTTVRSIVPEISFKEAQAATARLTGLSEQALQIRVPAGYRKSDAEIDHALAKQPTTATAFVTRGLQFLDLGRPQEAEADFSAALKLDANNAYALADRAIARTYLRQFDLAEADLKLAAAADPGLPLILRARGIFAHGKGDMAAAIRDFSAALVADPGDGYSRARRAQAHAALSHHDEALADAGEALKTFPNWAELHLLRANIFRSRSNDSAALAEADAIVATDPKNPYDLVVAANVYAALGAHDRSAKAFERALALKPDAFIYLNRSQQRPVDDIKGRSADLDAALKLDPVDGYVLAAKADLLRDTGKRDDALLLYNKALAATPDDLKLRISRGILLHQLKRPGEAAKDFDIVRPKLKTASDYNNFCYLRALNGVDVEAALADCNEALRREPNNPHFLDSRAIAYLRLGRLDDSLSEFNKAIGLRSDATILFGRALVWSRKGNKANAASDSAAALRKNASVAKRFEQYGLTLDGRP